MFIKRLIEKYLQGLSDTEMVMWKSKNSISEWNGTYREMMQYFFDGFTEWLYDNNAQQSVQRIAFGAGAAGFVVGVVAALIFVFVKFGVR